uniref:Secreted protein n=1 Tax=Ascaris lumbricoides TaxID=6252 RepID=A0A0M3I4B5_ASCLU
MVFYFTSLPSLLPAVLCEAFSPHNGRCALSDVLKVRLSSFALSYLRDRCDKWVIQYMQTLCGDDLKIYRTIGNPQIDLFEFQLDIKAFIE